MLYAPKGLIKSQLRVLVIAYKAQINLVSAQCETQYTHNTHSTNSIQYLIDLGYYILISKEFLIYYDPRSLKYFNIQEHPNKMLERWTFCLE